MRHRKRKIRLTLSQGQRKAILMNLAKAVFENKRIDTTFAKAKAVQPYVERIITYSKRGGLHAYRLVESEIHDQRITKKIVEVIAPNYKNRNGGYTRIVKMGPRVGDNAPMAVFELIGDFTLKIQKKKKESVADVDESTKEKKTRTKKVVKKIVVDKKDQEDKATDTKK